MSRDLRQPTAPLAEDFEVCDDSDLPGFNQPYAVDDVETIAGDPSLSVAARRCEPMRMLDDLKGRASMDESGDDQDLAGRVREALGSLGNSSGELGGAEGIGFDPDDRALAPDEILERTESEAEDAADPAAR